MSERQKRKKAKELEKASMTPKEPPTKLQKAVTHWLRKNVPTKKTKFLHAHVVEYFAASKAIGKEGCCMVSWYLHYILTLPQSIIIHHFRCIVK